MPNPTRDYWLGVGTVVGAPLALAASAIAAQAAVNVTTKALDVALHRFAPDQSPGSRRNVASAVYAAKRVYVVTCGPVGVAVVSGIDQGERVKAANLLTPKFDLRRPPRVREDFPR